MYYLQYTPLGGYGFTLLDQRRQRQRRAAETPTGKPAARMCSAWPPAGPASRHVGLTLTAATVVDRKLFYNNSSFDGNNAAANASDDAAIAIDKSALLPAAPRRSPTTRATAAASTA